MLYKIIIYIVLKNAPKKKYNLTMNFSTRNVRLNLRKKILIFHIQKKKNCFVQKRFSGSAEKMSIPHTPKS